MFSALLSSLSILISLSTMAGVVVHDTSLDKVARVAAEPAAVTTYEAATKLITDDAHVHSEHHISVQAAEGKQPLMRPRAFDDRKHLYDKDAELRRHLFGNNLYPLAI